MEVAERSSLPSLLLGAGGRSRLSASPFLHSSTGYYIQPACVPDTSLRVAELTEYYVSGWGVRHLQKLPKLLRVLQKAKVEIIDFNLCNSSRWYREAMHTRNVCAGYPQGGIDSCQRQQHRLLLARRCDQLGERLRQGVLPQNLYLHPALLQLDPGTDESSSTPGIVDVESFRDHLIPLSRDRASANTNTTDCVRLPSMPSPET
ncbi:hypothetical protein ASZ78_006696 [Callipepla squamata]|uniref:Peptidase S1 domain-containing protein n=1 Tax=Callipepla squamata TaxID=9009 RepID=A0A226MA09_CALSU|nr:hypothetical protein ASZ78_006696 [Callipepla squamata]